MARYDGRELPNWRDMRPAVVGDEAICRGGGSGTTAKAVLGNFERAMNHERKPEDWTFVIDETGLPTEPGENQTLGSICLSYHYAFGCTPESIAVAKEWFRDSFGITFAEEEREIALLEAVPAAAG